MKLKILFLITIISIKYSFAQYMEHEVVIIPQGFTIPTLSGYGNSGLLNDVSNIGSINPATINGVNKYSVGISYQFQSEIKNSYFSRSGSKRITNIIPQSFGLLFPVGYFTVGVSMNQTYNRSLLNPSEPIRTVMNPEGTGEYFIIKNESIIYNYSVLAALSLNDLPYNSTISFGLRIGVNNLIKYDRIFHAENDENLIAGSYSVGVSYILKSSENKYLKFGLLFESNQNIYKKTYEQINLIVEDIIIEHVTELKVKLPTIIRFDFDISKLSRIHLLGSLSNYYFNSSTMNMQKKLEVSFGALFLYSEVFNPSLGFLYSSPSYDSQSLGHRMKSNYITFGVISKMLNFNISFTLADSHLFSGEYGEQTISKISINYNY